MKFAIRAKIITINIKTTLDEIPTKDKICTKHSNKLISTQFQFSSLKS